MLLYSVSIIVYLIGAALLLLFMYQIARFYRSRLDPKTPIIGFLLALVALVVSITAIVVGDDGNGTRYFVGAALAVGGALGTWNSIALYIRMKRVYK